MAPESPGNEPPSETELAENEEVKDSAVLNREGVEKDLMQRGESDAGEEIEDVEDE